MNYLLPVILLISLSLVDQTYSINNKEKEALVSCAEMNHAKRFFFDAFFVALGLKIDSHMRLGKAAFEKMGPSALQCFKRNCAHNSARGLTVVSVLSFLCDAWETKKHSLRIGDSDGFEKSKQDYVGNLSYVLASEKTDEAFEQAVSKPEVLFFVVPSIFSKLLFWIIKPFRR